MARRKTTKEFILEAKQVHGNYYDYSLVNYVNAFTKVEIICPKHGKFLQEAKSHKRGYGCPSCRNTRKYSNQDFIEKAKQVHGNYYDYSLVNYKSSHEKIIIICPKHGKFNKLPYMHLQGSACPTCSRKNNGSKREKEIENILIENNIKYIREKSFDEGAHKFDFFLPEYNLLIEHDGIQHFKICNFFGGYDYFKQLNESDMFKNNFCKENSYSLLRIKYNQNIKKALQKARLLN